LAKVKGNYMNAGSDTLTEAIGYLTGIPVFSYTPTSGNTTFFSSMYTAF
jgi:hypothetical protein